MQFHPNINSFDWDSGNKTKNWILHKVAWWECEEVFLNIPLFLAPDIEHSEDEERLYAFGRTNANRLLTIVYTVRDKNIRVISARDMNRKERKMYHEEITSI